MRTRGFTLLEVMLAALIGAMIVAASIGVFNVLGDTDRRMGGRYNQSVELARLHLILQRATRTLLIAPDPLPNASSNVNNNTRAGDAAAAFSGSGTPPRLLLEPDPSETLADMLRRTPRPDDPNLPVMTAPQRLEIVLSDPPLPANFVDALDPTITQVAARPALRVWEQAQPEQTDAEPVGTQAVAVRGVFELRPDWATRRVPAPGQPETEPTPRPGDTGWTLWWRPLPAQGTLADATQDPRQIDPTRDVNAVPIASGIQAMQWTAFKDRQKNPTLTVTYAEDMPAYLELQLITTSGITANWMFEIGWSSGAETVTIDPLAPEDEENDNANGNGNGNNGVGGVPGAPRRIGEGPGGGRRGGGRGGDRPQGPNGPRRGGPGAPGGAPAPRGGGSGGASPLGGGGPR